MDHYSEKGLIFGLLGFATALIMFFIYGLPCFFLTIAFGVLGLVFSLCSPKDEGGNRIKGSLAATFFGSIDLVLAVSGAILMIFDVINIL